MNFFDLFIGTQEWSQKAQSLTWIYSSIRICTTFVMNLTNTFLFLYILDAVGFKKASIVLSITFFVRLITDYPFGAISDRIGQKWILAISMFFSSIGFLLIGFATEYSQFIIVGIVNGFANAQASGALDSWFDNNYQNLNIDSDPEKKEYGFTMNRILALDSFVRGTTFIIGGFLSILLTRPKVFFIESFFGIILLIIILKFMNTSNLEDEESINKDNREPTFLDTFKGGITFVFKDMGSALFVLGFSAFLFGVVIWNNLLVLPFYFGYAGSDSIAGLLRSVIFFSAVGIMIVISRWTKKVNKRSMTGFFLIQSIVLYGGMTILLSILPMRNQFSWIGLIIIFFLYTSTTTLSSFSNVLSQRVFLDYFPSEYRNSLQSFIPTISGILAVIFLPVAGTIIEYHGFIAGVGICALFALIGIIMMETSMRYSIKLDVKTSEKDKTLIN